MNGKEGSMIILMGLAGSGKSTQGQILADQLGRKWLSAGQVLRDTGDPEIKKIQDRGEMVDDRLVIRLMREAIIENAWRGVDMVLDGFPRNVDQAKWVAEYLARAIEGVILLDVPKDVLIDRMMLRGRSDDESREAIEKRFAVVEQNMQAVCTILMQQGVRVVAVSGEGTVEEVTARLEGVIQELALETEWILETKVGR